MKKFLNKKKTTISQKIFLILIFLVPLFLWSCKELSVYGFDFGSYYAGSYFLSEDYQLYRDHFEHKGPAFYLFIQIIGKLIGWGINQSVFTLFLSLLVFYLPISYVIFKYCSSFFLKLISLLLTISILNFQDSNSSIAFFQEGLLIISFINILKGGNNLKNVILVNFFFWLAFFTRVDSIIFLPLVLIFLIKSLSVNSLKIKSYILIFSFLIPFIIYLSFSLIYNFTLQEYFHYNFAFNSWYKNYYFDSSDNLFTKIIQYLDRPRMIILLTQSLIAPIILFNIFKRYKTYKLKRKKFFKNLKNFIIHQYSSNPKNIYTFLIVSISFLGFILTNSDRNYHALIFICPITFLVAINFDNLKIPFLIKPIYFLLYLLIPYTFISSSGMISIYKSKTYVFPYNKTLKYIKNNNITPEIVGGRGWPYFLSNKKPIRAINDWWLYSLEEPYKNNHLLKNHEKLLKRKSGYVFWINNSLIENQKNNILLNQIKSISNKIEDQGYYSMYRIK